MAKLLQNDFSEYEFENTQEEKSAYILNQGTIYFIRNLIAMEAKRKIAMKFDPLNPVLYAQEEAEIKGALAAYQTILDAHNDTISSLNTEDRNPQ